MFLGLPLRLTLAILLVVLLLANPSFGGSRKKKKKKNWRTPHIQPFSSRGVCLHVINDFGWFDCISNECITEEFTKWKDFQAVQKTCQKNCRGSTWAVSCEYGDVFVKNRSGIKVNLACQCNGPSSNRACAQREILIDNLYSVKDSINEATAVRGCAHWCLNPLSSRKNSDHCSKSGIFPQSPLAVRSGAPPVPLPVPLKSYTCACSGSDNTAEDDGEEIEHPE